MRILIIEDDDVIGTGLKYYFNVVYYHMEKTKYQLVIYGG